MILQTDISQFGQRLKYARQKREMTQRELADVSGVDKCYISRYETTKRMPSMLHFDCLREALRVPSDYLLGEDYYGDEWFFK